MGLRIRTNINSLIAQRHFGNANIEVRKHMERLSSGERINRAADDAAGLAISEGMKSDIRAMGQARRNTNDGVSMVQVTEGGLEEIGNIMIRLRELSVQSASDTIGVTERGHLNREFMALKDEIDRIAVSTEFNGTRVLTGATPLNGELVTNHSPPPVDVQVDTHHYMQTDGPDARNPLDIIRLDFRELNAMTEGEGSLNIGAADNPEGIRVDSKENAQQSLVRLDEALQKVYGFRAHLGALQNRLESADRNLSVRMENLGAARSRIRDADFASESAELTQHSILQQAGASVLAQANKLPQVALQLLQ